MSSHQGKLFEPPEWYFSERSMKELQEKICKSMLVPQQYLMTKSLATSLFSEALLRTCPAAKLQNVTVQGDMVSAEVEINMAYQLKTIGLTLTTEE